VHRLPFDDDAMTALVDDETRNLICGTPAARTPASGGARRGLGRDLLREATGFVMCRPPLDEPADLVRDRARAVTTTIGTTLVARIRRITSHPSRWGEPGRGG
jgi:hypothetical protein